MLYLQPAVGTAESREREMAPKVNSVRATRKEAYFLPPVLPFRRCEKHKPAKSSHGLLEAAP